MNEIKNYNNNYDAEFSELVGKTITNIEGRKGDDTLVFICSDGVKYQMHYYPDCCAHCYLEDVVGDLNDLINSPILKAEETTNNRQNPHDVKKEIVEYQESFTWTFYHLSTVKGSVTLRWYGSSNGYYSESVTFERLE